ncbi:cell division protein ZapA [Heliobacterium undosum]|uniref:Cell division protein ZapA n=1 Tax=Heliomicrobium undosum TaxID=121734 RepID=A0A845L6H3_9FIRM|nr:cell division protein ZapA [Heliomicrobium undosum]
MEDSSSAVVVEGELSVPEEVHKTTVHIYGEPYTIRSPLTSQQMRQLAATVDERMSEISRKGPHLSVSKVAVMAALHFAHDLAKLQEDYDDLIKLLEDSSSPK